MNVEHRAGRQQPRRHRVQPQNDATPLAYGHGETILLAERDAGLLKLERMVLERLNYRVLTADSEKELFGQLVPVQERVDLVILDAAISWTRGPEIVAAIHQQRPEVKVLFFTVCDWLSGQCRRKTFGSEAVVSKPFSVSGLSRTIEHMLH